MNNEVATIDTSKMTISTLEIAEMMEMEHKRILRKLDGDKDRKGYIQILTETHLGPSDYFIPSTYKDASGKENKCYLATKLGCDFLANKFTGEKGVIFTAKYVKRFDEMEKALKEKEQPSLPTSYKEALIQLVQQIEENERLEAENKAMLPKAQFHDAVTASSDCITIEEMSKILRSKGIKVGRNRLFEWLRIEKVLMKNNLPYQEYLESGYFKVREYTYEDKRTHETKLGTQTLVTPKGQKAIVSSWVDFMEE